MNVTAPWLRNFGRIALAAVFFGVLTNCSKKDVTDDGGIAADSGAAAEGEPAASAGEAGGVTSADLRPIYYSYDSYNLTSEARSILKANANWLQSNTAATIQIEGHCDERGTTEYNLALGERRANAAKAYLTKQGIDGSRVSIISYGEERPSDPGHDESAWAKNRRAEMVILSQ